jgi:hypothetical protein
MLRMVSGARKSMRSRAFSKRPLPHLERFSIKLNRGHPARKHHRECEEPRPTRRALAPWIAAFAAMTCAGLL